MPPRLTVTLGEQYGRLTIVEDTPQPRRNRRVRVRCVCGALRSVALANLRNGHTKSCGCLTPPSARKPAATPRRLQTKHGHARKISQGRSRAGCEDDCEGAQQEREEGRSGAMEQPQNEKAGTLMHSGLETVLARDGQDAAPLAR